MVLFPTFHPSMYRKAQVKTSYFDAMNIGDRLTIFEGDPMRVEFEKLTYDTGKISYYMRGQKVEEFEIDYDYDSFPASRAEFVKRIRYIFLRDFSEPKFQNQDLKSTRLRLVNKLNLGHGIYIKNISKSELPDLVRTMTKARGSEKEIPDDPERILPEKYLEDFLYVVYLKNGEKEIPLDFIVLPYEVADEAYDLQSSEDIQDFFIDLVESKLGDRIESVITEIRQSNAIPEDLAPGPLEGGFSSILTQKDIFNFYQKRKEELEDGSAEEKNLTKQVGELVRRIRQGEHLTEEDLSIPYTRPERIVQPIPNLRMQVQVSQVNKEQYRVEQMFSDALDKENNPQKKNEMMTFMMDMRTRISDLKMKLEDEQNRKDFQTILLQIKKTLEEGKNFIKK